ncbi:MULTISPECIES: monovalent cation:proton antiporter-2 (CPA2) family protein [unclassified Rhizobium]|uniref:monovalent cation:proton antiporter-2 (CPA2) family protein n=1 Tax=unclassified Rhizobium TaxID=2613769 RepID=UPI000CDF56B5|nr:MULTISPECIES: monovalent cation:proton antiporter-2 (CPA2) family protein [Rhizobium]AVA20480.1 glutathione-regulated potassium-efflux transporter protein KefB [Rhizobium sp. NXC24]MDK4742016.1 monovalent cation:proton antiporter-2 (CPA2) family protein [Rhizobium sp. CNPSo 3464]UWU21764.1 monovalent cation:proton antiporter-2 (CPA2) family protein [Rhizobium tropici]
MSAPNALFTETLMLLGGAVVTAPIFKKLGLGTVLGYLAAGVVIGPVLHGIGDGESVFAVAELGVVFLLFIIGLELKPSRLWQMRRDIFGLGTAQVVLSGLALTLAAYLAHIAGWRGSIIVGFGLALSSTAFAMQILEQEGDVNTKYGQRSFSMLLLQDLAIVPLLALVTVLGGPTQASNPVLDLAIAVGAVAAMIIAGRYLLTPLFQVIARTGAREAMIAAALLVVMGSATLMQLAGLSMAMGAFLSGVMLAESSYRHELEADIEPFRGVLLAIFFIAVGLSLKLDVIADNWALIVLAVPVVMVIKGVIIYALCRVTGSSHDDAIRIACLLPQGGEFGFVLFSAASVGGGLFSASTASLLIAIVTLSMALTPLGAALSKRMLTGDGHEELDEDFEGAGSDVLMIGFSRFGQIAAQILLAGGRDVTVIDFSADRIRQASNFGFRIYFGDGTRKDVLRSAGIDRAKLVVVSTHQREITDKIVELVQTDYPHARIFVRSYDRIHSIALRNKGVDFELRETLESGLLFGRRTLEALGVSEADAFEIGEDIRKRDEQRLVLQVSEGLQAGRDMLYSRPVRPEPLVKPKRSADVFSDDDDLSMPAEEPERA